jgi:hypothetical protein
MRLVLYLFFVSLSILFLRCFFGQSLNSFNNDYMPLAIGNKWFYNVHTSNDEAGSEVSIISEIISIDTIEGKNYFRLKYENVNSKFPTVYYHQRMSNDTLYTLNYDQKSNLHFERVTAIFTLDSGDVARIELPPNELSSRNEAQGLPTGRKYLIKAINKNKETIELFTNVGGVDGNYTETYKRGIGMIKSKNDWGIVTELIDNSFNN